MIRIATQLLLTIIACVLIFVGGSYLAIAQNGDDALPAAKSPVAVVNVGELFQRHERFRASLEQMKVDVKEAEKELGEEGEEIKELSEEAKGLDAGEPLRQKLDVEVAERTARLRLKMESQKNDFMKQEAVLYANVYKVIEVEVAAYCRAHGISLVLRSNASDKFDETSSRDTILKGVNRQVIFQDGGDITEEIAKRLNRLVEKTDA